MSCTYESRTKTHERASICLSPGPLVRVATKIKARERATKENICDTRNPVHRGFYF